MNAKSENIDRFFKKKLENYEDNPAPVVWDNISEKLGHKKKRTLVLFMSRVAAGITLIIAIGLGYYFLNKDSSEIITESSEQDEKKVKEKAVTSPGKLAELETEEISGKKDMEKYEISEETDIEKSKEALLIKQYEKPTENKIITAREKTYEPALTSSLAKEQSAETDNYKSGNILSRIKSIIAEKIKNTYAEDIKIAERIRKKPAGENLEYPGYITEEEISYTDTKAGESKWTVGGQLGPLYSYRNVSSDYLDSYVKDQINSKESGIITYAMGLNVAMSPGKRLSIQSGLYYSKYGQQTDAVNIYEIHETGWDNTASESTTNVMISQSIGTVSNNNEDLLKFNQSINDDEKNRAEISYFAEQTATDVDIDATATQYFEYLEIPLIIRYKIIDRKIDFNLLSGISTHFLIGNDIYLDYDNMYDRFPENVNINNMNYSGSFGIGIEYPILSKLMLNVEPRFKYYLNPIVKNPSYNIHPYSFGIFTGINYLF
jgi:hypothetical protein